MKNLSIESLVYLEPPIDIPNSYFEDSISNTLERLNITKGFLEEITGIKNRKWFNEKILNGDIASEVGELAIQKANIDRNKLGCIINCSVCKDFAEPTLSLVCHNNLKLSDKCMNMDISNTCAGFSTSLDVACGLLYTTDIEYVLIIASESSRQLQSAALRRLNQDSITLNDFYLEFPVLTLGSAAVAMIITKANKSTTGHIIKNSIHMADTRHCMLTYGNYASIKENDILKEIGWMKTDGSKMIKEGKYIIKEIWKRAKDQLIGWNENDIDLFIPHQVSKVNNDLLSVFLPIPSEKLVATYSYLGNTGPAAWPTALYIANKEDVYTKKNIGILSMGSGFNCYCITLSW